MTGEFMAEEQKARMQAVKDSEFRAANDDGEPAQQTSSESGLAASPPEVLAAKWCEVHLSGEIADQCEVERCLAAKLYEKPQPCRIVPAVVRIDGEET